MLRAKLRKFRLQFLLNLFEPFHPTPIHTEILRLGPLAINQSVNLSNRSVIDQKKDLSGL